jgi:hypothetical protein
MNTKKVVVIGLVGLVLMGLLGATAWVVMAYRAPLGPALELPSPTTAVMVEVQADLSRSDPAPGRHPGRCPGRSLRRDGRLERAGARLGCRRPARPQRL